MSSIPNTPEETQPPRLLLPDRPAWERLYKAAWEIALKNVKAPSQEGWLPHMTCMPGVDNVWGWDSCFMTIFARYGNGFVPTMECLDNMYRLQREDGYISMAYCITTGRPAYGERVNPPLYAWAEWNYWQLTGDDSRLPRVIPVLVRLFDWLKANRRRYTGLYWFEDTASAGMDNSPRSGYPATNLCGSDVCYIDLAAQQALSAECIGKLARRIGNDQLAARMTEEYAEIKDLVDRLHWDERSGFYYDLFGREGDGKRQNFLNHKTVASFWPLLAGLCSATQADRLVDHLVNRGEFWTAHPVASLSKDDPNYDPKGGYWLGGVWAPTNYMIAKGLRRYGYLDIAEKLAREHIDAMARVLESEQYGGIWEAYAPDEEEPATDKFDRLVRSNFVGWSGLGPVVMLIEDILGFEFNSELGQVTKWQGVKSEGDFVLESVPFNGGTICFAYRENREQGMATLDLKTTVSLCLRIQDGGNELAGRMLSPGRHTIDVPLTVPNAQAEEMAVS